MDGIFGVHGIRGKAMTVVGCETALGTGRAYAHILKMSGGKPKILIAWDTRASSGALSAAAAAGICSVGGEAVMLGVLPTSALSFLVKRMGADGGIMLTASNMGADFAGIKLFSADGGHAEYRTEASVGYYLTHPEEVPLCAGDSCGQITVDSTGEDIYVKHIISAARKYGEFDMTGKKIAIDCANGAAYSTAGKIFSAFGAGVYLLNASPDGKNINSSCGSSHIEGISSFVRKNGCIAGVAFDGDADRCVAVDEKGTMIDGDKLLAIFAKYFSGKGMLTGNGFVSTVISNLGLRHFAERNGIGFVQTKVSDRYVLDKLKTEGYTLGGEPNGSIVFSEDMPFADGQLTAARLFYIMMTENKPLSELAAVIERCPQVMASVKIPPRAREIWKNDDVINDTVERLTKELGSGARLVIRESGSDPIIRIMAEGKQFDKINAALLEMQAVIKERTARYAENKSEV